MQISNNLQFQGKFLDNLIKTTPKLYKPVISLIALQEAESGLSHVRFIQDTVTNWVPKAAFSRSKADFSEMSFLELSESVLVYYFPALLGEKVFRKLFSRKLPENLRNLISNSVGEILNNKNLDQAKIAKLLSVKAAIALSCLCIPLTEYCLNYAKNLLTLKMFKQADFNNVANLNKIKAENQSNQGKVKNSAEKHIKLAGLTYLMCLGTSLLLAFKGDKSKFLQNISKFILEPGTKLFSKNSKLAKFFNKYFSVDFADNSGKLSLSRGQLTSCVLIGAAGYFGAAKDRGKQNFLEVLSRYPLVGFYVITGSELFEKGFKRLLYKKNSFKNLINDKLEVPKLDKLPEIAEKLAKNNDSRVDDELRKLLKGKMLITGIPFAFSIGFMGFFVAGMTRFWTEYRFKKEQSACKKITSFGLNAQNVNKNIFQKFIGTV